MEVSGFLSVLVRLLGVLLLVLANAFFVGAEFALVSVRRSRLATLIAEGNTRAQLVMRILDDLQAYISAGQVGVTLASLALGWIGEGTIAHLLEPLLSSTLPHSPSVLAAHTISITLAFVAITYLHLVLGEFVPKALALDRAERMALAVAPAMRVFYRVFTAPMWLINKSGVVVLRWLGVRATAEHTAAYSEEELRHLIGLSHKSGHLIEDERQLIYNVFDFTEASVESVMIPRTEIEALEADLTPAEMLNRFEDLGYSRMPVYRDSLDSITGILLYKDLTRTIRKNELDIDLILRPPVFLPTSVRLNEALRTLRRSSAHMALVVDEHGGVEGLVTIEDLLEEIVGDISDEHDEVAGRQIVEQPDGSYSVRANLSIRDLNRRLDFALPEGDSYHTIAGFMMARAGRLLRPGEHVDYNGLRLTVQSTSRNRIVETRIERLNDEEAPAPSIAS
jgi:magnesium and cobalt exporter, CNNM family